MKEIKLQDKQRPIISISHKRNDNDYESDIYGNDFEESNSKDLIDFERDDLKSIMGFRYLLILLKRFYDRHEPRWIKRFKSKRLKANYASLLDYSTNSPSEKNRYSYIFSDRTKDHFALIDFDKKRSQKAMKENGFFPNKKDHAEQYSERYKKLLEVWQSDKDFKSFDVFKNKDIERNNVKENRS